MHLVVDILATGVALRRGTEIAKRLERIKETMSDQWLAEPEPKPSAQRRHGTARVPMNLQGSTS